MSDNTTPFEQVVDSRLNAFAVNVHGEGGIRDNLQEAKKIASRGILSAHQSDLVEAKRQVLKELREAMVVQQNNPWGIKLIDKTLKELESNNGNI